MYLFTFFAHERLQCAIIHPLYTQRVVAQLGRALRSGRRGRRFKSCQPDHFLFQESLITAAFCLLSGAQESCTMKLSMIIPAYNEEENIRPFYQEALRVFGETNIACELIFIDDGSKDNTYHELQALVEEAQGEPHLTVCAVSFSRNFGKEAALYAGLKRAQGDLIAFIDADLQQEPKTLLEMVHVLESNEDIDCVAACQKNREGGITAALSHKFYKVLASSSNMEVVQDASDFRVFRRCVADALLSMGDYQRFSKGLFSWVGFKTYAYPYTPSKRHAGESTWSFWGLWRYAFDGLFSFSVAPLRSITSVGIFISIAAFIYLVVVIVQRLAFGIDVPGYATIVVLILFLGGAQLLALGFIGEYLSRMYIEGKHRPIYIERRFISSENNSENASSNASNNAQNATYKKGEEGKDC